MHEARAATGASTTLLLGAHRAAPFSRLKPLVTRLRAAQIPNRLFRQFHSSASQKQASYGASKSLSLTYLRAATKSGTNLRPD
jgi:hypothetical protein